MNWREAFKDCACILGLIALLGMLAFADKALAADLERALRDAARYSRYDVPRYLPRTIIISSDEIDLIVPPVAGRSAWGYFHDGKETVYLSGELENLDPIEAHGWVIHEYVHALQKIAGRSFETCIDRKLLEAEAYAVQSKYLKSRGYRAQPFSARLYPCH